MSNIYNMLPKLVVNKAFISDFITSNTPCCAIGVIEDRNVQSGLLALRLNDIIPNEVLDMGFNFGHCLLGTSSFEVVQFAFEFYGYKNYNVIINPNNKIIRKVLPMMIENGGYFVLIINPNNSVTAFRSSFSEDTLQGLSDNLTRIKNSNTSYEDYQKSILDFSKNPKPQGEILNWVCYDNENYIDLTKDRLVLNPQR